MDKDIKSVTHNFGREYLKSELAKSVTKFALDKHIYRIKIDILKCESNPIIDTVNNITEIKDIFIKQLESLGFDVDAVDISDYALGEIKNHSHVLKIEADLDTYNITPNKYDLIINMNYLNRRLASQMKEGL